MRREFQVFKIIPLVILPIFLNSCSSSSYYERYGNQKTEIPKVNEVVEDETSNIPSTVSSSDAQEILNKLQNVTGTNNKKLKFLEEIVSYLNTPYRYGGESRSGIDCSAFTQKIYKNSLNVIIPRTAREQYRAWDSFSDKDKLRFGDLIYFDTSTIYFPGHVGIYLDDNLFAHASSSRGVIVSSLENEYYLDRYIGANRVKINTNK